jgi:hypothetical protein
MTIAKGTTMSTSIPKPEYPRPDRDRSEQWLSLNGVWDLTSEDGTVPITVPFSWETPASGVGRTWLQNATYTRSITLPNEWSGRRVFLEFGAVWHRAVISIDGRRVGEHEGGYSSFEFDITDRLSPGVPAELRVDVTAPSDKRALPHGKQRSIPRDDFDGVDFTPTSGIWQSVWLEARGRSWVDEIVVRGDALDHFAVSGVVRGDLSASIPVTITVDGVDTMLTTDEHGRFGGPVAPHAPRLWSPADPYLYELSIAAADDTVRVTAGLRHFEARGEQLFLNGERFYMRGVLDQGYWPSTGPTAPDDAALLLDLQLAKGAGYNLVRKHYKFEEPRFFHHADRMGMLVWAEPAGTSRWTPEGAANFEAQIAPMVARDGNHPCIVIWGLYNEEWGLDWDITASPERAGAAIDAYNLLHAIDDTRPIVENSGWSHVKTDLVDWHYYDESNASWASNLRALAEGTKDSWEVNLGRGFVVDKSLYGSPEFPREGVPIVNSEYGAGFTPFERSWNVRWQTQELRRHDRFAGYVYTELADVEHEPAGLFDVNRQRKDWGGLDPADANAETTLVVDLVPLEAGADIHMPPPGFSVDVHVSHHGAAPLTGAVHAVWVSSGRPFPAGRLESGAVAETVTAEPFALSEPVTVALDAPQGVSSSRLLLWLVDQEGKVRARTFIDAAPVEQPNRRGARAH